MRIKNYTHKEYKKEKRELKLVLLKFLSTPTSKKRDKRGITSNEEKNDVINEKTIGSLKDFSISVKGSAPSINVGGINMDALVRVEISRGQKTSWALRAAAETLSRPSSRSC